MKINSAKLAGVLMLLTVFCMVAVPKHTQSLDLLELVPQSLFVPTTQPLFLPTAVCSAEPTAAQSGKPRVLIYHTHLTEAYRQDGEDQYREAGEYRTFDNAYNVAVLGELLKTRLEERGFQVTHDITNHEPPKLATAYSRSVKTMEQYDAELYIDLHRDASGAANFDDVVTVDGKRCARMMFVVGKGYHSDGTPYDPLPDFEKNFALAEQIAGRVNAYCDGFMRETRVKRGRYNQHVSDQCLLVEVGHNMNTLTEAKNAIDYLAAAIAETFDGDG